MGLLIAYCNASSLRQRRLFGLVCMGMRGAKEEGPDSGPETAAAGGCWGVLSRPLVSLPPIRGPRNPSPSWATPRESNRGVPCPCTRTARQPHHQPSTSPNRQFLHCLPTWSSPSSAMRWWVSRSCPPPSARRTECALPVCSLDMSATANSALSNRHGTGRRGSWWQ